MAAAPVGAYGPQDRFWNLEIADPGADRIFANAIYYRGGMTFQALRHRLPGAPQPAAIG